MKSKYLLFFLIAALFLTAKIALAVNMESENYIIQWGNINIGARDQSSENYVLGVTMGQIAPGLAVRRRDDGTWFRKVDDAEPIENLVPKFPELAHAVAALLEGIEGNAG